MSTKLKSSGEQTMAKGTGASAATTPTKSAITIKSLSLTNTVGDRIQWARTRRQITQAELAKRINKARATVVQYENDNIPLSLDVCEAIAKTLMVAPEYLAFGVQGLHGVHNAVEEIATLKEITYGKDGKYSSGNWAMPISILNSLNLPARKAAFYTLPRPSIRFDFTTGMRLLVDQSVEQFSADHEIYLVEAGNSIEPVSFETDLTDGENIKLLTGGGGEQVVNKNAINMANKGSVKLLGAVVGYFKPVM